MRKILFALVLVVGFSAAAAAEGAQETNNPDDDRFYGRGMAPRGGYMMDDFYSEDPVEVSGALKLVNGEAPVLVSGSTEYQLMVPWFYLDEVDVKDGQKITVEGYETPGPRFQYDDDVKGLMVTMAVIDGKEYEIDHHDDYDRMPMSGGRMGGRMDFDDRGPSGRQDFRGGMRSNRR